MISLVRCITASAATRWKFLDILQSLLWKPSRSWIKTRLGSVWVKVREIEVMKTESYDIFTCFCIWLWIKGRIRYYALMWMKKWRESRRKRNGNCPVKVCFGWHQKSMEHTCCWYLSWFARHSGNLAKRGLRASYVQWKCSFPKDRPCQGMGKRHDKLHCFLDCFHGQSKEEHSSSETSVVCGASLCVCNCLSTPLHYTTNGMAL